MHDDLRAAVDQQFAATRRNLEQLVRVPSVSAPDYDPAHVRVSAQLTASLLEEAGLTTRMLESAGTHPAVFGELAGPSGGPTVLLYAHHDVQPPGPESEWESPPFEPVERDGRLYGRGTSDDKSGIVVHVGAIEAHRGSLPVSIKVIVEGEEEISSPHLEEFLGSYGDLLAADVIVIADSANWRTGRPAFTTSLRGLVDCVVEVRTAGFGVHSGQYGGAVPDALTALSRILATLHDAAGEVAIAGLVRGDAEPLDLTEAQLREEAGTIPGVELIGAGSLTSRIWAKPAVSVLAIDAPPVGEAINQLVPAARAKVSLRLAPGDDPRRAMDALVHHLRTNAPWGVAVTVTPGGAAAPFSLETAGPAYEAFHQAFTESWGTEPLHIGQGGSIPLVSAFRSRHPSATILLTGAGDDRSRAHGPNESVDLDDLRRSVLAEAIAVRLLAG